LYQLNGNANSADFNFQVILDDGTVVRPAGGVTVTDAPEFGERLIDAMGVDHAILCLLVEQMHLAWHVYQKDNQIGPCDLRPAGGRQNQGILAWFRLHLLHRMAPL
jgi:hypothetical protein